MISRLYVDLKEMRRYIAAAAIIFFASVVVGATNEAFSDYLSGQLAGLGEMARVIEDSGNPTLAAFIIIFLNNTIKSILVMYLGALLGLLPIVFLVINGMIIGYLYTLLVQQGENAAAIFVKGILPHGILEIPAILIACAYGMKFGMLGFKLLGGVFTRNRTAIGTEYESFAVKTLSVMGLLTVMLLIAAVIESTLSKWLLSL